MRIVKTSGAALLLAALLLGVPWALLSWGKLAALLDVDWRAIFLAPDDGTVLIGALTLIGWLIWLFLASTTVAEVIRLVTGGSLSWRLPGSGWLRPVVGALVATALTPILASSAAPPEPADQPLPAEISPLAANEADPSLSSPADELPDSPKTYVVAPGDELWSIAQNTLQDGDRWRDIIAVNPGLTHETPLPPGMTIQLPHDAQQLHEETALPSALPSNQESHDPRGRWVTVEEGDTLWALAEAHLQDPERWPEIHRANLDQIDDPDVIDVGWQLLVPIDPIDAHETAADESDSSLPEAPVRDHQTSPPSPVSIPTAPEATPQPQADAGRTGNAGASVVRPDVLGRVGAVLAAGIFAGMLVRRRGQLSQRGVGRRLLPFRPELRHFWSLLGRRAHDAEMPKEVPATQVTLGWVAEEPLLHDLEKARCTLVTGQDETVDAIIAAAMTSLSCTQASAQVDLVVAEPTDDWVASLDDPRIRGLDDSDAGLTDLQRLCSARRIAKGSGKLAQLRADDELASTWSPVVYVFREPLTAVQLEQVQSCLSLGDVGVSVLAPAKSPHELPGDWTVIHAESNEAATKRPGDTRFAPQLLSAPARRAIIELFSDANSTETEPAPWWVETPLPPNVKVLPGATTDTVEEPAMPTQFDSEPLHPTLLLLGPVGLVGYRGTKPTRSLTAALECCTWLLANPGCTPSQMIRGMVVAETTRRSNVSRLRTWLGEDAEGNPYLPDAYSGHLELHLDVTSDWEQFQLLLSGGVNHASAPVLREALGLITGEPLADTFFQWPWAEQLRADMISLVTDAAAMLFDRSLEQGDTGMAEWAIARGRLAVGHDEVLSVREIQLLAAQGNRPKTDQAIRRLTRAARAAGRDLNHDSVQRIQRSLHLLVSGTGT